MRIEPVAATDDSGRSWNWQWINQWPAVLRPRQYNWIDFDFISVCYEHEKMMGNAHEVRIVLLGLGFRWSANFRRSDLLNRMVAEVDQIKAELRDE